MLYSFSLSCHYVYSRNKGVWPEEVRQKWFIVPRQANTWNVNWHPVCSVRRSGSDWCAAVKRQDKEDFHSLHRPPPSSDSRSSKITDSVSERRGKVQEEWRALVLKVDLIHISELVSSWVFSPQDDILKAQFWPENEKNVENVEVLFSDFDKCLFSCLSHFGSLHSALVLRQFVLTWENRFNLLRGIIKPEWSLFNLNQQSQRWEVQNAAR